MQLIAGRTAQEYNQRKKHHRAFWEDRYHATAVDTEHYLARCMAYIDLNMVRAGAVSHPVDWCWSGYCEIQKPPQRYAIIDVKALLTLFGVDHFEQFQQIHKGWIEDMLKSDEDKRIPAWTQNIAVGSQDYLLSVKTALGVAGRYKAVVTEGDVESLKEPFTPYIVDL